LSSGIVLASCPLGLFLQGPKQGIKYLLTFFFILLTIVLIKMMKKKYGVIQVGADILRQKSLSVSFIGRKERAIIKKMQQILRKTNGLGLAAPQIGERKRIIISVSEPKESQSRKGQKFYVLVNPKIIFTSRETDKLEEGCLSFQEPEIRGVVERSTKIKVKALNEKNNPIILKAENMLARSILHEIDHLDGILFTDRADPRTIYEVVKRGKQRREKWMVGDFIFFLLLVLAPWF